MTQRLTPVDILNLRFRRRLRGYTPTEVDEFMRRAAADLEATLSENAALRERLGTTERELAQYRTIETTLRDALLLAQKAADETRAAAHAQAEAQLQEAQARLREMEVRMQERTIEMSRRLDLLRQERRRLARDLHAQLSAHLAWLSEELKADPMEETAVVASSVGDTLREDAHLAISEPSVAAPAYVTAPAPPRDTTEDDTVAAVFPASSPSPNVLAETESVPALSNVAAFSPASPSHSEEA
jgi:cell division initiation protein